MSDKILIGINLWVYLYTKSSPEKHQQVREMVANHFQTVVVSTQVLGELYNVLNKKGSCH
jgi:predicted nucleic acid-binding protein